MGPLDPRSRPSSRHDIYDGEAKTNESLKQTPRAREGSHSPPNGRDEKHRKTPRKPDRARTCVGDRARSRRHDGEDEAFAWKVAEGETEIARGRFEMLKRELNRRLAASPKAKRAAAKYAEQDEEDRALA